MRTAFFPFFFCCTLLACAGAAPLAAQAQAGRPLATMLHADGTLDLSQPYSGSLDARGFHFTTDADGQPRFRPAAQGIAASPDDVRWSNQYGALGTNGDVYTAIVDGTGNLYIGGRFTRVNGLRANNIAQWDGTKWSALGTGMNYIVFALAAVGSDLYAGGQFTTAGGISANRIAKWDGTKWSALGTGASGDVLALATDNIDLYVGGSFVTVGGVAANRVAKYAPGSGTWSSLGTGSSNGVDATVLALAQVGGGVYVGGDFTNAGGAAARHIAEWDGTKWAAIGGGVDGPVYAINTDILGTFIGGDFRTATNGSSALTVNHIAQWDGTKWAALGKGSHVGVNGIVRAMAVYGTELHVGGDFAMAGNVAAGHIARWDLVHQWRPIDNALKFHAYLSDDVHALAVNSNTGTLFVGGQFDHANRNFFTRSRGIVQWTPDAWQAFKNGPGWGASDAPMSIVKRGGEVCFAGYLTTMAGLEDHHVVCYDGKTWTGLGTASGTEAVVKVLAVDPATNDLYAGGSFAAIDGTPAEQVARWDGNAWHALGLGVGVHTDGDRVEAMMFYGGNFFVGGDFARSGATTVNNIAYWNGTKWSGLGAGFNGWVQALAADAATGTIYAGGLFTASGSTTLNRVAQWTNTGWVSLGTGMNADVMVLLVDPATSQLYAGGAFTTAGGTTANGVARWDGTNWAALGTGVTSSVRTASVTSLALNGQGLYVGGRFDQAGGVAANNIAQYNTASAAWTPLGSGTNHLVFSLLSVPASNTLYVGGIFDEAGGKSAGSLSTWEMIVLQGGSITPLPRPYLPGRFVDVPYQVTFTQAFSLFSAEFDIPIPDGLTFLELRSESTLIGAAGWSDEVFEDDGTLRIALAGTQGIDESGPLFTLRFEVPDAATGPIALTLTRALFNDGLYTAGIHDGTLTPYLPTYGDVDRNEAVQAYDASLALQFITEQGILTAEQLLNADVTQDGSVSALDATFILQNVTGETDLPVDLGTGTFAGQGDVALDGGTLVAGDIVEVALTLQDGGNLYGFEAEVAFDPQVLALEHVQWPTDTGLQEAGWVAAGGRVRLAQAQAAAGLGQGEAVVLQFRVVEAAETEVSVARLRWNEDTPQQAVARTTLVPAIGTSTAAAAGLPQAFRLHGAYPNPFNPSTTLRFDLPTAATVQLQVFDLMGRLVAQQDVGPRPAGANQVVRFEAGSLASGVYLYRVSIRSADGMQAQTGRFILLK